MNTLKVGDAILRSTSFGSDTYTVRRITKTHAIAKSKIGVEIKYKLDYDNSNIIKEVGLTEMSTITNVLM